MPTRRNIIKIKFIIRKFNKLIKHAIIDVRRKYKLKKLASQIVKLNLNLDVPVFKNIIQL